MSPSCRRPDVLDSVFPTVKQRRVANVDPNSDRKKPSAGELDFRRRGAEQATCSLLPQAYLDGSFAPAAARSQRALPDDVWSCIEIVIVS